MIVEFSSGAEMYFGTPTMRIPDSDVLEHKIHKVKDIITYLYRNHAASRSTVFQDDHTLAPGILCCINEVDWELLGCEEADVSSDTNVLFLSTMHGG